MRLPAALLGLCLCAACLAPRATRMILEPIGQSQWHWRNADLSVTLEIDTEDRFIWRFENHALLPVALSQAETRLVADDGEAFSLWGQPWKEGARMPPIQLRAGGFTSLAFPVQHNSRARGLPPAHGWTLELVVRWGKREERHILRFAMPKDNP